MVVYSVLYRNKTSLLIISANYYLTLLLSNRGVCGYCYIIALIALIIAQRYVMANNLWW